MDPIVSALSDQAPAHPPLIISRSRHPISRSLIDEEALKVLYRLHRHGFLAYLVGGGVRDLLLGRTPKDFDVATNAHPHEINALFKNSRMIGHRFRLIHIFFKGGKIIEVSTFRSRSKFEEVEDEGEKVTSRDSFGTPDEDAFRRDITINGLFYNIADFSLIDYVGGMADLERGIIRTIGDPDERYSHDPVRMIRVIRHAARTGFAIEEKTYQAILEHRDEIRTCSPSRLRDEFLRDLREGASQRSLTLMLETGLLFSLFPDFERALGDRNPLKERAKKFFLTLFDMVDQLYKIGNPVSEPILLSLFLIPYLQTVLQHHPFLPEKERDFYRIQTIRWALHQIFDPFSFPRGTKEMASQTMVAQISLEKSILRGVVPHRFKGKKYFREALLLYGLEAQAKGEKVPYPLLRAAPPGLLPWWHEEIEILKQEDKSLKPPSRKKRRGRFRRWNRSISSRDREGR